MMHTVGVKCTYDQHGGNMKVEDGSNYKSFMCNICEKNFSRKSSLTVHINTHTVIKNHSEDYKVGVGSERQNVCNVCNKKFTAKKNLLKHLREVHKNFKEAERMVVKKIKCPERNCEFICRMMKELRDHIEKIHEIKILKDTLQFPNETAFQKWKKEEESNTVSWFVTNRKKTTLTDGTKKQTLCCHRTGHYNPKGFGKYRMKSVGSCKIGGTCPAAMEITEFSDDQLSVIYYKTHLGHMQDVVYLKLSREERAHLAEKIEQGFSFDAILEDIKESNVSKGSMKKRIQLLSKKDLYGIMKKGSSNSGKKVVNKVDTINKDSEWLEAQKSEMAPEKVEESITQNLNSYSGVLIPQEVANEESPSTPCQKTQENPCPPQTPGAVSSQIVILSPEMNYTSVAEIILLSAAETASNSSLVENKFPNEEVQDLKKTEMNLEEKSKLNRTNLRLQLNEKIDRILGFLPDAEFLSPKQFDLIKAKLDGILNIFSTATARAKRRRRNLKKSMAKSYKLAGGWERVGDVPENKITEEVLETQMYESPVVYAVYN